MKKKKKGIESLKSRYGRQFVLLWEIGLILFIIVPLIHSVIYSFSNVSPAEDGLNISFIGIENYRHALFEDANFLDKMNLSLTALLYSVPSILVISLVIAIILNQKFKGRIFFRALYFFPVIIATGIVINVIVRCTTASLGATSGVGDSTSQNMINVADLFDRLGLSGTFVNYFQTAINEIFNLVWKSGVQIVLFISGLQSIPDSLYEVSKVEGATKWEEFWFITIPMLGRVILLVLIFTIVELVNDTRNNVMKYIYTLMSSLQYGESSAMLWIFFVIVGIIIAFVMWAFSRFCLKRWDME